MVAKLKIEYDARVILFLFLVLQLLFINGFYLFAGILCLYFISYNLQQAYKPSVFTIIFIFHLIQIIAAVWFCNYLEKDIDFRAKEQGTATLVSLAGLVVMFAPVIYFQNKIPSISFATFKKYADELSIDKTFRVYVVAFIILGFLGSVRFLLEGYTQIIVSLVVVKWFLFLLFGFQCILKNRRRKQFYFFIGLEFFSGLGFFSDFKTVLFYIAFISFMFITSISLKLLVKWIVIIVVVFFGAILWTTVKNEYREFLNQGKRTQNVSVSRDEAISKLYELSKNSEDKASSSSVLKFLDRLQGTYHLSLAMQRVPMIIPYQNGKNWGQTFEFVLTPRLLNPDKPILDQSVKASTYTGIQYAGYREGTAVSLGYFADCYIDFGIFGMMIILFLLGVVYGYTYFFFMKNSSGNYLFNCSVVGAIFMEFFAFDMDNSYFLGRFFSNIIIFFVLKFAFFPWLIRYLAAEKSNP